MWIDKENTFNTISGTTWTAWAETTVAAHNSPNVIDLTHIPRVIIENARFVVQVVDVPVSAGGGTLQLDLVTSAATALTSPQTLWSSGVVSNATIVAYTANSTIFDIPIPSSMLKRYMGVIWTIGTAVWTAGSFRMFLASQTPEYIPAAP